MISASRVALVCLLLLGAARSARAGDPEPAAERANDRSDQLFRDGRAAFKAGDCEAALRLFDESERIEPAVGTLINLALCEECLGRVAAARDTLADALARALPDDQRRTLIQDRIAELNARLATPTASGNAAPRAPSPAPVALLPKADDKAAIRGADLASPSVPPPVDSARPRRQSIGRTLLGAGAAAIAIGLASGAAVLYEKAQVNKHCDANHSCDGDGLADARWGRRFSLISTATTALGIASAGVSVYFLVGSSDKSSSRDHYFAVRKISPVFLLPQ